MRRVLLLAIIVLGCFGLSVSLVSCSNSKTKELEKANESEQAALTALKKLKSKIELGINIKDYTDSLQEAKFAVEQVNSDSKAAQLMRSTVEGHILALNWWRCDLEGYEYDKDAQCRDALMPNIFDKYPSIKAKAEPVIEKSVQTYRSRAVDKDSILKLIWIEDHKELIDAEIAMLEEKK